MFGGGAFAFRRIDDGGLTARRNSDLELHGVDSEAFVRRRAVDDLPLITLVAFDALAHERLRGLRSTVGQNHLDPRHESLSVGLLVIAIVDDAAFQNATRAKERCGKTLADTELSVGRNEGDTILANDLGQGSFALVDRDQPGGHRRAGRILGD